MSEIVRVTKVNEVHMKIECEYSIHFEIQEFFSFRPNGYQFNPRFRHKIWDGFVREYRPADGLLALGLIGYLRKFCVRQGYTLECPDDLLSGSPVESNYGEILSKKTPYEIRDYQNMAVVTAIRQGRQLLLSPTASGKSFIIYLICMHHLQNQDDILIIVPTKGLVRQMAEDFVDYGHDPQDIHQIMGGVSKNSPCRIQISTWQSLVDVTPEWVNRFGVLIGDEAHLFQAASLKKLFAKATDVKHRYGTTGTLGGDSKCHRLVLEGIFGNVTRVEETINLINNGTLADLKIKGLVLHYSDEERKELVKLPYAQQREWIFAHDKRNRFIRNLASQNSDKNTLIMFELVEKHGKILLPYLKSLEAKGFKVHFIWGGGSPVEERDAVRKICESSVNNIILASSKIFSTGVNIKRLHTLIFASANKSRVTILQSIGRLLRKIEGADKVECYDITDDLSWKKKVNYTLAHFRERVRIYLQEGFDVKIYNIGLTGQVKPS